MQHTLNVQGMTCGHCEAAVIDAIRGVDPHAVVTIDRSSGRVEVRSESAHRALAAAIADEGYTVEMAAGGCGGHCSCG